MKTTKFLITMLMLSTAWAVTSKEDINMKPTPEERKKTCNGLKEIFKNDGKLVGFDKMSYCLHSCRFVRRFNCLNFMHDMELNERKSKTNSAKSAFTSLFKSLKTMRQVGLGEKDATWMRMEHDSMIFAALWEFFWPYLAVIIPLTLQWILIGSDRGRRPSDRGILLVLNVILLIGFWMWMWEKSKAAVLHYAIYSFLSSYSVVGQKTFMELVIGVAVTIGVAFCSYISRSVIVQVFCGVAASVLFGAIFIRGVVSMNESDRVSVITAFGNALMTLQFLFFIMQQAAITNAGLAFVELVLHAFLPYGSSGSLVTNASVTSAIFVDHLGIEDDDTALICFFWSLILYFFVFLASKSLIGMMLLARLNFDWNFNSILTGGYAYAVDLIGPLIALVNNILAGRSRMSDRRIGYSVLMLGLLGFEVCYGQEFLLFRIFLMTFDYVVVRSGLADSARFLDFEMNLEGIAYPKVGAFPFASLDLLVAVRRACYRLKLTTETGGKEMDAYGVGTVVGPSHDERLLTVRHVLDAKNRISFDDDRCVESVRTAKIIGTSSDPAVLMLLTCKPSNSVEVSLLALRETGSVTYLFMISPEGMVCPVSNFRFDNQGDLHAIISLKQGDSGSPIVAVLKDGQLRIAGTVSRGSASQGTPNIISSVAGDGKDLSGDRGMLHPTVDVQVPAEGETRILRGIESALEEECEKWKTYFHDDLDRWDENKGDFDWGAMPPDVANSKRRRVKNYRKNAAARKQAFQILVSNSCLTDEDTKLALTDWDNHRARKFNIQRNQYWPGVGLGFVGARKIVNVKK